WSQGPGTGAPLINAHAETVAEKPAFRSAFQSRRCLIPADGFFEWLPVNGKRQPYFRRQDGQPFAFAGLWERWQGTEGPPVESCTILTTEANEVVRPEAFGRWLDPSGQKPALLSLLRPCPGEWLTAYPVSTLVNNTRNDSPECVEPL